MLLAAQLPYDQAAKTFERLTCMSLGHSSLHRLVQQYGGQLVALQAAESEAMVQPPAKFDEETFRAVPEPDSEVMAVSMDGAFIHLRGEGWKEVKTVAISAVECRPGEEAARAGDQATGQPGPAAAPARQEATAQPGTTAARAPDEPVVRLSKHSYRAGLWEAAVFAKQQWAEAVRRGVEKARQIVCVNDGAVWIWTIVAMCYAPCIEILDWWHALEKLWLIGNLLFGEHSELGKAWVKKYEAVLWAGNLRALFHDIHTRCRPGQPRPDGLNQALGYMFTHRHRMRYREFRLAGYPVGSGTVESACKLVVEARMKQAGMMWNPHCAQAMLALRSTILSERWDDTWPSLARHTKAA